MRQQDQRFAGTDKTNPGVSRAGTGRITGHQGDAILNRNGNRDQDFSRGQGAELSGQANKAQTQTKISRGRKVKNLDSMWQRVCARLRAEIGEEVFQSWFTRVQPDELNGGILRMSVPTRFLKSWIHSHYEDRVLALWKSEDDRIMKVELHVRKPKANVPANENAPGDAQTSGEPATGSLNLKESLDNLPGFSGEELNATGLASPLDPRFTLESFVVGDSNRLAFEAARQIARPVKGGAMDYNILYIHGGVGLGKTHLLQSVTWAVRRETQGRRVIYLTAERFMYRFVAALKAKEAIAFKDQLRNIDLLLIDDMQFLQGPSIQQEFCHTLNALIEAGRQVMIAADRPPSELDSLDERVRSRLSAGLVADLGPLDVNVRLEILQKRLAIAKRRFPDLTISDDVLEYVAKMITGNGRDLEGAFTRIVARNQLARYEITVGTAESAIRDLIRPVEPKRVRIERIQRIVAKHFNVTKQEIVSSRRTRSIVRPRQISMYLAKTMTNRSFPDIGRRFGGRDHTTVLHAVRKIEGLIADDPALANEIALLRRVIEEMID